MDDKATAVLVHGDTVTTVLGALCRAVATSTGHASRNREEELQKAAVGRSLPRGN